MDVKLLAAALAASPSFDASAAKLIYGLANSFERAKDNPYAVQELADQVRADAPVLTRALLAGIQGS